MDYRLLDITIISAKDLKDVNLLSKMEVYAVASLAGDPRTTQRTPVDRNGGKSPIWNFPMKFSVDEAALRQNRLTLHIQIRCDRVLGDRDIGEVHVPVKELFDSQVEGKAAQSVSYQVRRPSGKPKGMLNFSYKFGEKFAGAAPVTAAPATAAVPKADEPVMAYPPGPSTAYPPAGMGAAPYPPPPAGGYPPPSGGYPPPPVTGYGYGAPPPPHGYGYPPAGYGYQGPVVPPQAPPKKNKFGMGLGAGLLGGALGGLLIGDMISDASSYDAGYDAGFDDGGGFDF